MKTNFSFNNGLKTLKFKSSISDLIKAING